eukprot:gene12783-7055_t
MQQLTTYNSQLSKTTQNGDSLDCSKMIQLGDSLKNLQLSMVTQNGDNLEKINDTLMDIDDGDEHDGQIQHLNRTECTTKLKAFRISIPAVGKDLEETRLNLLKSVQKQYLEKLGKNVDQLNEKEQRTFHIELLDYVKEEIKGRRKYITDLEKNQCANINDFIDFFMEVLVEFRLSPQDVSNIYDQIYKIHQEKQKRK